MATTTTNPDIGAETLPPGTGKSMTPWPGDPTATQPSTSVDSIPDKKPSHTDALQALLAFSALHEQVRRRKSLAARATAASPGFDAVDPQSEFEAEEQFVLDE